MPARFGQLGLTLSCSVNAYHDVLRGPETCWPSSLPFAMLAQFGLDVLRSVNGTQGSYYSVAQRHAPVGVHHAQKR